MAADEQTFSESWFRVANERVSLRPGIRVQRQRYRGALWYVLENPWSNQFFRIRPEAYALIGRLRPDRTVQEVWEECMEAEPESAPGQGAVIQLLSQLYHANLLQYQVAKDSQELFERFQKRQQRETRARLTNIMFMRIPLIDPDSILDRTRWLGRLVFSWFGGLVWLLVALFATKIVLENVVSLKDQSQALLSPGNLPWLYLSIIAVKLLHEFGHAYACKRYGGEVHTMGIMLLILTPIPYMDATSSWGFRSRWKRMLVGGAGMLVETFVAAIATIIWHKTAPGVLHNVCFNVIFIASVSTLLFNINPLLRFDGYYMLSDWLEIPNLHQRAAGQLKHRCKRYLFGMKTSQSPARSRSERFWITMFGILSNVYRIVVFTGILLFVADRFLILGLIMAAVCLFGWVILPLFKLVSYLCVSPELERYRKRALGVTALLSIGVLAFLQLVPFPNAFRAPGVLQAKTRSEVYAGAPGIIAEIMAISSSRVEQGQTIAKLTNQDLDHEIARAEAVKEEVEAQLLAAMDQDPAVMKPLTFRKESADQVLARLQKQRSSLEIKAPHTGLWISPNLHERLQTWVPQGAPLGIVLDDTAFVFQATVDQDDANRLFNRDLTGVEVRLFGQSDKMLEINQVNVVQGERRVLPSASLGWQGGGDVATAMNDPNGRQAAEPFFEVSGDVVNASEVVAYHGHSGKIRFPVEDEPLLPRAVRRVRQLLQERYQF